MIKKNLFVLFVFYFFVVQLFIAGLLWWETNFYILGGANLIAMLLVSVFYRFFTRENEKKAPSDKWVADPLLVKEKITLVESGTESLLIAQEELIQTTETIGNSEELESAPISESNIEYIKTKINRAKKKPLAQGSGLYRLLMFLLALIGLGGVLYLFWDTFDFFALVMGAIGMMIFIAVIFKAANLWRKSIFSSLYFLFFFLLAIGGILGMSFANTYQEVDQVKEKITTFIDGIKGKIEPNTEDLIDDTEQSNFLFEETGEVLGLNLTWEGVFSWDEVLFSGDSSTWAAENLSETEWKDWTLELSPEEASQQLTMIEAIKNLMDTNNIPLSEAKNARFTYVASTNADYPYMKTALEKRMIGTATNPFSHISCDVYIVMKGLAEGRNIQRTADVKADFWNAAVSKDALNGCQKGAILTKGNL